MRGRPAVPTALKVLRGNPGKRALPVNEPNPTALAETTAPPEFLNEIGRAEWKRMAPMLARNGLLTELDTAALAAYCRAFAQWRAASDILETEGSVVLSRFGHPHLSPHYAIAEKALATMRAMMREFGMTPSARAHVSRATPKLDPLNPLDKFIRR